MTTINITIDPEFESLIQPLASQELDLLTEHILRDGCLESLVVWKKDDQRILLDGHNRYKICREHHRDFQTINIKMDSREHAKLFILEHQTGRRNLTDDQRAVVWNEIREQRSVVLRAEQLQAARDVKAGKPGPVSVKTADTVKTDTRAAVAKESKIPESKLRKVAALKKSNPELYNAVGTGKIPLREAKPTPAKKTMRDRYSEKDFYARIGRMLAGTLLNHPLLDELLKIQRADWTEEAQEGISRIILSLRDVNQRVDKYAAGLKDVLKRYGKKDKAA